MAHSVSRRVYGRLAALAGVLATIGVMAALSAPSASAAAYCGGQTLTNYQYCYGTTRNVLELRGYGTEKSVCVGISGVFGGCSGTPHEIVRVVLWEEIYNTQPWIEDNAAGPTVVYGESFA